ncbi:MAG: helix-turn-helix domain-containing protein [bacterium]
MRSRNVVGPRVKEARHRHDPKLTQQELAITLQLRGWDIDRFGVSRIERGVRQVTDRELLLLSNALDVTVSWLLRESQ